MGFGTCVLMIRGNHLALLPDILERFRYGVKADPNRIEDRGQAFEVLASPREPYAAGESPFMPPKAACFVNGWTVILDPKLLMSADEKACARLSRQLKSRVFAMYRRNATGTYSYVFCDEGHLRVIGWLGGTVEVDKSLRVMEEGCVSPADPNEEDILGMMQRIGVDYFDDLSTSTSCS